MGLLPKELLHKGSSNYDTTWSLFDFYRGRGGQQDVGEVSSGFVFTEQANGTNAGENVSVDNILSETTCMTCITAIVQGVTQIPIQVRKRMPDGSAEIMPNHPIMKLMHRPNDYQTATEFKSSIVTAMLTHGNSFIYIVRAGDSGGDRGKPGKGRALQLYPLDPSDVTIGANALGRPVYNHDTYGDIPVENMIHIRDLTTYTPMGLSRVLQAAEIVGAKKAADRLMSETFKSGASFNYAIELDGQLDATKAEALQKSLQAFAGRGSRRGGVALIENGTLQKIDGLKPADTDLRELREALIREIAAVFRVPEMMAGGTGDQKYNNVRQQWAAFHRDTLQPIVTNIEEAITFKLLSGEEYLHFDIAELLKGDVEVTARIAQQNVSNGIWTPNEGRMYIGTKPHDSEEADILITPNSTTNLNLEETPENATGGEDGPQGALNVEES